MGGFMDGRNPADQSERSKQGGSFLLLLPGGGFFLGLADEVAAVFATGGTNAPGGAGDLESEEGIDDLEGADAAFVLEVLGVENGRAGFDGGGGDEGVVEAVLGLFVDSQGLKILSRRRINANEREHHGLKVVSELEKWYVICVLEKHHVAKLLADLAADDDSAGYGRLLNQRFGNLLFPQVGFVEAAEEDVGIEKEFSAHSFRRV